MDSRIIERLSQLVRPEIRAIQPYQPEDEGPTTRLDANESPFDVPDVIKNEITEAIKREQWQRYPDPDCKALRQAIGTFESINPDRIIVGNGSDEIIRDLLTVYGGIGARTVFPSPTFSMYRLLTIVSGASPVGVRLNEDWSLDMESMLNEVAAENTKLVFIANPNNPTGQKYSIAELEKIINTTQGLVVIDEAYRLFSDHQNHDLLQRYPNVVILHTFSKSFSLAGLRLGYMLAHPIVIEAVNRIRLPYNVDRFVQVAASIALKYQDFWREQSELVKKERTLIIEAFKKYDEIVVYNSQANFILIRCEKADEIKNALRENNIAVRGFANADGLNQCLRITVGQPADNQKLIEVVQKVLDKDSRRQ